MIVTVHGKNITITNSIEEAIKNSLQRLEKFKKLVSVDTTAKVEVRSYPDKNFKVTVNIPLKWDKHLHCEVHNIDLYTAIKAVVHPLEAQLNHLKKYANHDSLSTSETLINQKQSLHSDYLIQELEDGSQDFDDYENKF